MLESESSALPLGDTPIYSPPDRANLLTGWDRWIRTTEMTESKSAALPLGYIPKDILAAELQRYLPEVEQATGIEPASSAWEADIITAILRLLVYSSASVIIITWGFSIINSLRT